MKLTNEGADPSLIPQVIDAVFKERKERSREKQGGEDELLRRLSAIIDGRARCEDHEADRLRGVAAEKARRLDQEIRQYQSYLLWCGFLLAAALVNLLMPLLGVLALGVRYPWIGALLWPLVSAALATTVYSARSYFSARRRRAALQRLANDYSWWNVTGPD